MLELVSKIREDRRFKWGFISSPDKRTKNSNIASDIFLLLLKIEVKFELHWNSCFWLWSVSQTKPHRTESSLAWPHLCFSWRPSIHTTKGKGQGGWLPLQTDGPRRFTFLLLPHIALEATAVEHGHFLFDWQTIFIQYKKTFCAKQLLQKTYRWFHVFWLANILLPNRSFANPTIQTLAPLYKQFFPNELLFQLPNRNCTLHLSHPDLWKRGC